MFQNSCFNKIKELSRDMFLFWAAIDKNVDFVLRCLVYLKTAKVSVNLTKLFMDELTKCSGFVFGNTVSLS